MAAAAFDRDKALDDRARADREAARQGLGDAPGRASGLAARGDPDRLDRARRRARHRRAAARPGRRDLRPGELSGKTTVALHAVANAQAAGGVAAFIDAEHALDPDYAQALGVDTDALLVSQPDTGEQALEIADMLIRSGALDIIVIDSVAALVPRAEIEGEMGDSHVGLQARLMSQALRKITGALSNSGTTAIFINQLREKIGVMFGSPETTTGGKALKFYSSVRLDVRRIETLKDGTEAVGNRTRVKVVKNKVAPPFKQAEFDIVYGQGISREGSLIDVGVEQAIVRKSGAWYTYEGDQLGSGQGERAHLPARQPGPRQRDREEDQGEARHRGAASMCRSMRCRHRSTSDRAPGPHCASGRHVDARVRRRAVLGRCRAPTSRLIRRRSLARSACDCSTCALGPEPSSRRSCAVATCPRPRPQSSWIASPSSGSSTTPPSLSASRSPGTVSVATPDGRSPLQLRRRGVADEVINDAIAQIDPASEAAAARQLARVRLARMGQVDSVVAARRLTGLLARRGYSSAVASSAVRAVVGELDDAIGADDGDSTGD